MSWLRGRRRTLDIVNESEFEHFNRNLDPLNTGVYSVQQDDLTASTNEIETGSTGSKRDTSSTNSSDSVVSQQENGMPDQCDGLGIDIQLVENEEDEDVFDSSYEISNVGESQRNDIDSSNDAYYNNTTTNNHDYNNNCDIPTNKIISPETVEKSQNCDGISCSDIIVFGPACTAETDTDRTGSMSDNVFCDQNSNTADDENMEAAFRTSRSSRPRYSLDSRMPGLLKSPPSNLRTSSNTSISEDEEFDVNNVSRKQRKSISWAEDLESIHEFEKLKPRRMSLANLFKKW